MSSRIIPTIEIGNRIRFVMKHKGAWRPLLWVRAGRDGSLYLGMLLGAPSTAMQGEAAVAGGKAVVDYREGRPLAPAPASTRVSFKASGAIHLSERELYGPPLTGLIRPRQLCLLLFTHPSRYRPAEGKPNDVDVTIEGLEVDDSHPLYGALIVAPLTDPPTIVPKLPSMTHCAGAAVGLRGFGRAPGLANPVPDLLIQVLIGRGPKGPWPTLPTLGVRGARRKGAPS